MGAVQISFLNIPMRMATVLVARLISIHKNFL